MNITLKINAKMIAIFGIIFAIIFYTSQSKNISESLLITLAIAASFIVVSNIADTQSISQFKSCANFHENFDGFRHDKYTE
jgi:hypothetical protein